MFSRDSDKPVKVSNSSSVIGTEMQISGNIKCSGSLVLRGKVKGNIECENMSISPEGNLKGNIKAFECIIGGNFEGDVFADSLAIESAANIKGNMYYNNLRAQPGAKLEVQFFMGLDKEKKNKLDKDKKKPNQQSTKKSKRT
ncbi:MAG: polymer-forming cytoskeletal protein [Pseudomonadota bacterium]|nr:polymer-forming cytoskeletal protein [Pseudomonadota bacterium]